MSTTHLAFAQQIDGEQSFRQISQQVALGGVVGGTEADVVGIALDLLEQVWRSDFIAIDLSGLSA